MEEEVILNKIIEDAEKEADLIMADAEKKAKEIEEENRNKAIKQSQEQFEVIKAQIESEAIAELEKAEFESRSSVLAEKKQIIEIVKEKVKQKIKDLSDDEYIKIIDEKIANYKNEENVELILPGKCYDAIKKIATGYQMKVLEQTEDFESGVIVKCGNIEYNYDFEENMRFMDEEIEKEIDTILFKV